MAGLFDDLASLGLRVGIVARIEQGALPARLRWLRQDTGVEMVECLDDARPRNEPTEYLAGMLATKIDRLDAVGSERIVRVLCLGGVRIQERDGIGAVDDDTAVPNGQTAQRFFEI